MKHQIPVEDAARQMPEAPQDDAATMTQPGSAEPNPGEPAGDAGPYYRSQREVDAAFAKRIAAERRRWEQQRAGTPFTAGGGGAAPVPPPPDPAAMDAGVGEAYPEEAYPEEADPAAQEQESAALSALAARLAAEEAALRRVFPGFSAADFLQEHPDALPALLERPLWEVALPQLLQGERDAAEAAALDRVRDRMSRAPDPLRSAGAPGAPAPDYSSMSSEQFRRVRRGFEEQMRLGKKVRP